MTTPYTIVQSTQFFEFIAGIAGAATKENEVHLSTVQFQPIAAEDVASFVTQAAVAAPVNGYIEIAGPDRYAMSEIVARYLQRIQDPRQVIPNGEAQYFGAHIGDTSLVPAGQAQLGTINFEKWMNYQLQQV